MNEYYREREAILSATLRQLIKEKQTAPNLIEEKRKQLEVEKVRARIQELEVFAHKFELNKMFADVS